MNKYLIVDIVMVLCCMYMAYGLGSYQIMPDISEVSAFCLSVIAIIGVLIGSAGIYDKVVKK